MPRATTVKPSTASSSPSLISPTPARHRGGRLVLRPQAETERPPRKQPSPATVKEARTLSAVLSMGNYVLQLENNYSQTVQRFQEISPPSQPQVNSHKFLPFPCPSPWFPFTPKGTGIFLDSFYSALTTPPLPFSSHPWEKGRERRNSDFRNSGQNSVARDSDITDREMKLYFLEASR